jgi:hypothetical protein
VEVGALRTIARKFLLFRNFNDLVDFGGERDHGAFRLHAPRLAPSCFRSASWDERGRRQEANR